MQVGLASLDATWDIPMVDHMNCGKQILGCVQGDATAQTYVPRMIDWFRKGPLPVDTLVSRYRVEEYQQALEDIRSGKAIKPVLIWTKGQPLQM